LNIQQSEQKGSVVAKNNEVDFTTSFSISISSYILEEYSTYNLTW